MPANGGERVVPARFDFDAWLKAMAKDSFSDEFVEAVERQVENRGGPYNPPRWAVTSGFP